MPIRSALACLDGFDVEHAAFHFLADDLVAIAQVLGVGGQQFVGQVIGLAHGLGRLGRTLDRHGLRQLRFPQRARC